MELGLCFDGPCTTWSIEDEGLEGCVLMDHIGHDQSNMKDWNRDSKV